jgi:hypothetical protein
VIYFDTSALVKLVKEPESAALTEYLIQHAGERKGSSMCAQMIIGDLM